MGGGDGGGLLQKYYFRREAQPDAVGGGEEVCTWRLRAEGGWRALLLPSLRCG